MSQFPFCLPFQPSCQAGNPQFSMYFQAVLIERFAWAPVKPAHNDAKTRFENRASASFGQPPHGFRLGPGLGK